MIQEIGTTATAFSYSIGVTPSVISDIVGKRKNKPSFGTIEKIIHVHPDLNLNWLFTGAEPIFHRDPYHIEDLNLNQLSEDGSEYEGIQLEGLTRQDLIDRLKEKDKLIFILKEQVRLLNDMISMLKDNPKNS